MDAPNERSLHGVQTPRVGGLGIAVVALAALIYQSAPLALILGFLAVAAVSFWDDCQSLSVRLRLGVHVLAAAAVVWALFAHPEPQQSPDIAAAFGAWFLLIWFSNCYNFMDGSDGLAGAQGVLGFAALGCGLGLAQLGWVAWLVSAACGGFLLWNWPREGKPSRLFMGDVGAISLGFLAAALGLQGIAAKQMEISLLLFCFFPFLIDASVTLTLRLLKGEAITEAHREHVYQRLILAGKTHRQVLWLYIVYTAWCVGLGFAAQLQLLDWSWSWLLAILPYCVLLSWALRADQIGKQGLGQVFRFNQKMVIAYCFDVLIAVASWVGAYYVRFNFDWQAVVAYQVPRGLPVVIGLYAIAFFAFGLYRGLWRFASLNDFRRIALAVTVATALIPLLLFMVQADARVPRSVLVMHYVVLLLTMTGGRLLYRSWKEHRVYGMHAARGEPLIILGAGEQAAQLVHELQRSPRWRVVALLDDDVRKHGHAIDAIPVLGGIELSEAVSQRYAAQHAVIAMPRAAHQERRRAAGIAAKAGLKTLTMPSYHDLISGGIAPSSLREVELEDLLGRDPIKLDDQGLADWLQGKTVLVTGAGGSIGSELCYQLSRMPIGKLVAFEFSEPALYDLTERAATWSTAVKLVPCIGDIKDAARLQTIMGAHSPDIVFHAAAYKHVPLMEEENAWSALRNNSYGTWILAQAALKAKVSKFVLISTDKAVNPSNIMGASKRLAERIGQACNPTQSKTKTQFIAVRFGNVLGSSGSVVPKFRTQIARHEPISLTDLRVERYFMSVQEASQLVLQAGLMGRDGEVFVMDMGEPVKIVDLAKELIRLAGHEPETYPIEVVGMRPGEKLTESWMADYEQLIPTGHERLRLLAPSQPLNGELSTLIAWLEQLQAPADLRGEMLRWVPEYAPASN
jgi:FlaA1/EpsC-like NDP-sugar epimerase/UDP-N-acetylmuramyl pentapeptide phosphotransferase/UDP-N-acetylglucosamine-1-phosphate transferase